MGEDLNETMVKKLYFTKFIKAIKTIYIDLVINKQFSSSTF